MKSKWELMTTNKSNEMRANNAETSLHFSYQAGIPLKITKIRALLKIEFKFSKPIDWA